MAKASKEASDALTQLDETAILCLEMSEEFLHRSAGLKTVLEAVMILLNEQQDWMNIQKVMADPRFIQRLKQFDKNKIAYDQLLTLEHRCMRDRDSFHIESMQRLGSASKVAIPLCEWVHAMVSYAEKKRKSEMFARDRKHKRLENRTDTDWNARDIQFL